MNSAMSRRFLGISCHYRLLLALSFFCLLNGCGSSADEEQVSATPLPAANDNGLTFNLKGIVADDPISGATVSVYNSINNKLVKTVRTNAFGQYTAMRLSSPPPYRIMTKEGSVKGAAFKGELSAYCPTEAMQKCNASPYTSALDRLMQVDGLTYAQATAMLSRRIGISYDPFLREIETGVAVPASEFDLKNARAALTSKEAIDTWISDLAAAAKNPDSPYPPPVMNCKQAVHIVGGSGTDKAQNDLMYQIYKWVQPKPVEGCTLEANYYTGINVDPAYNIYAIRDRAIGNICRQIANGVQDIYLFGFSRGSIIAVTLADVEKNCHNELVAANRTDGPDIVKFVGLVDPVKQGMDWTQGIFQYKPGESDPPEDLYGFTHGLKDFWTSDLPKRLGGTTNRSLIIEKTINQTWAEQVQWQQFYLERDPTDSSYHRIRVYGNMCMQDNGGTRHVTIEDCQNDASQKFILEKIYLNSFLGFANNQIAGNVVNLNNYYNQNVPGDTPPYYEPFSMSLRIKSVKRINAQEDARYLQLSYIVGGNWFEFKKDDINNADQIFTLDNQYLGQIGIRDGYISVGNDGKNAEKPNPGPGTELFKDSKAPWDGITGLLTTTIINNYSVKSRINGLWHQDLQCTLDVHVADDGSYSYPTNARQVEYALINQAQANGLHFINNRPRQRCDDHQPQEKDPYNSKWPKINVMRKVVPYIAP